MGFKYDGVDWRNAPVSTPDKPWWYHKVVSEGHTYNFGVRRMDDEHNNRYPNNATGYKWMWYLDTDESFYGDNAGTVLADGYTMTLAEALEMAKRAYNEREDWRKDWQR